MSSEADGFLEYLFSAVARRPRPLALQEGARVARYLKALAWETEPGPRRRLLERLAELIWGMVLQFASFELGGKPEVVRFLERHAGTYLAGCDLEVALKHVRDSATPMHYGALFQPAHLMSRSRSAQGRGNPHLIEDLSERIYVGYHALRRAGVRNVRARIAEALNRQGLRTRARENTLTSWGPYEVYERVKQHEQRLKTRFLAGSKQLTVAEMRSQLVDAWTLSFRLSFWWEGDTGGLDSEKGSGRG